MPGVEGLDIETLFAPLAHTRRLALAVSGGPDSLALMLLAAAGSADSSATTQSRCPENDLMICGIQRSTA